MASNALSIPSGSVSKTHLTKLVKQAQSLRNRAKGAVEKAGQMAEKAVHSLEVGSAAFAMSMLSAYHDKVPEIAGVPLDLGGSILLHAAGFTGMAGKSSDHLHGFADGLLAHYAVHQGAKAGAGLKAKAQAAGTPSP